MRSTQFEARRLRLFAFEVFFFGTAMFDYSTFVGPAGGALRQVRPTRQEAGPAAAV
ncbi:MAG: hypothetical protein M0Z93_06500 [Actinomycetota bacterium]|nr:hypothetical protein [Actinomycetota bacterium]